jgi:hypothetical protein
MALLPKVKLKAVVSFPAAVFGGAGIAVRQENGKFYFDLDFSEFAVVASIPAPDLPNTNVLTYNVASKVYLLAPYGGGGGSTIDPATAVPLIESGAGAVGVSVKYAREDHVHPAFGGGGGIPEPPNDAALYGRKQTAGVGAWARAVALAGDTMTGALILNADPVALLGAATKQYVDSAGGHGECVLALTGGNLVLSPKNGNALRVAGVSCTIPDAGVSLAPTGFTVGGNYYIYAVATAGVITSLEANATAYAVSTTAGNKGVVTKSGDNTRTLVGFARAVTGPAWASTDAQRFVRSWFNDPGIYNFNTFTTTRTTTSTSFVEINSEIRIEALIWAGETWDVTEYVAGFFNSVTNSNSWSAIGFNGSTTPEKNGVLTTIIGSIVGTAFGAGATVPKSGLTEGYNYATVLGKTDTGQAGWSSSNDGNRTALKGYARR